MLSSALYVAFVFCGILFMAEAPAYPGKRYGKETSFLECISMQKNTTKQSIFARVVAINYLLIQLKKFRGICNKFGKQGRLQVT